MALVAVASSGLRAAAAVEDPVWDDAGAMDDAGTTELAAVPSLLLLQFVAAMAGGGNVVAGDSTTARAAGASGGDLEGERSADDDSTVAFTVLVAEVGLSVPDEIVAASSADVGGALTS